MARSRSRPIHREAHAGLKQLILREKFWMRFDPAKNKLIHTPEYTELLLREGEQRRPPEPSEKVRQETVTQENMTTEQTPGELLLSAEQRAAFHEREVAYRRQQPRFRMKHWGSGRWKKEEGYVLRLLASHRQKMLQHELQKARRRGLDAKNSCNDKRDLRSVGGQQETLGEDERDQTSQNIREGDWTTEQQPTPVEERVATLSYSFIIKEVVPRLAALEKEKQQPALEQWKSYERQREQQQQRLRAAQVAERVGQVEEDGMGTAMSQEQPHSSTPSLIGQLRELSQKKKMLMKKRSQVLSLDDQQHLFLGQTATLKGKLFTEKQRTQGGPCPPQQFHRDVAFRTRQFYLQFLSDLHFVFTSFENLLTEGLEALVRGHRQQEGTSLSAGCMADPPLWRGDADAPETSASWVGGSMRPSRRGSLQNSGGRQAAETAARPQEWRNLESLEEFVSCLSFRRGAKSGDDLVAVCELLKRSPPPPSTSVETFLSDIAELQRKDFLRALSRIYHFHKEWHVAGRWFLAWLTRRQQLLPKRLRMTMWDADTDSLEVAIDLLSLTWSAAEKADFLDELTSAGEAAKAALAKPLLEGVMAAHKAVLRGG